jgi:hypothetical protein
MNIATIATPGLWTPLQDLLRWLAPVSAPARTRALPSIAKPHSGAISPIAIHAHASRRGNSLPSHLAQRRPLRIVRIMEAGQTPAQVGRMVISGRMADVCAELDRLAACEASRH